MQWRQADLVDHLNAELVKLQRKQVADPFVFVELRKWLPEWAAASPADEPSGHSDVSKEIAELAKVCGPCGGRRPLLGVRGRL